MTLDLLPALALVPAGAFVMGSDHGDEDERPAHRVHLDEFLIGVHPVSNAEYAAFTSATGHRAPAIYELPLVVVAGGEERERTYRATGQPYVWPDGGPPPDRLDHPVTLVRWEDAVAYCDWLSRETGRAVRLPTEAEWEKAARGGAEGATYPWGDAFDRTRSNCLPDPQSRHAHGTTPRGTFPANPYGLHDVAGNVWEWVQDWYSPRYYHESPPANPSGPEQGQMRVVRGGSWLVTDPRVLTCSHRHQVPPDTYSYAIGFRVVCRP